MIPVWKLHKRFKDCWDDYRHKDLYDVCKSVVALSGLKNKGGSIEAVRNNWAKVCSFLINWEGKK